MENHTPDFRSALEHSHSAQELPHSRRDFITGAFVGATAIAAIALTAPADANPNPSLEFASADSRSVGYRESPHIRRYYRLAREI